MKTINVVVWIVMMVLLTACGAGKNKDSISEGQESGTGNGGGGLLREGELLTFGQYGITVKRRANTEVLGLKELENGLDMLTLPQDVKGKILRAITPYGKRKYYDIAESELGPKKKRWLLEKYQSAIRENIPLKHLRVLAVTVGEETFLLPDFYKLSDDIARAAILFHEAVWVINHELDYKVVIGAEIAFEKFLRDNLNKRKHAYDVDLMQSLKLAFKNPYIGISTAAKFETLNPQEYKDSNGGPLGILPTGFPVKHILGDLAAEYFQQSNSVNRNLVYEHLYKMHKINPNSALIKELLIESPGMDGRLLVSFDENGGSRSVHVRSPNSESRHYFTWAGVLGDEEIDLTSPYYPVYYEEWGSPKFLGFTGKGGTIGMVNQSGAFPVVNRVLSLLVSDVQVDMPNVVLEDKEICEEVVLSWPHELNADKGKRFYRRCYQAWH